MDLLSDLRRSDAPQNGNGDLTMEIAF